MPKRLYPKNKFQKRSQKNGLESSEIAESNLQLNIKSNDKNKVSALGTTSIIYEVIGNHLISGNFLLRAHVVFTRKHGSFFSAPKDAHARADTFKRFGALL